MSVLVAFAIRLAGMFGLRLSPFAFGALAAAGVVLAAGGALMAASKAGAARATATCNAKALAAEVAALTTERDSLAGRVTRSNSRAAELSRATAEQVEEIERLKGELAKRALQSTKEGAKRDPQALLDDRCGVTGGGLKRLQ